METERARRCSRGTQPRSPAARSAIRAGREERGARRARVTLHHREVLQLERTGDLGDAKAGMLIFVAGRERPEYADRFRPTVGDVPLTRRALARIARSRAVRLDPPLSMQTKTPVSLRGSWRRGRPA